MCNVGRWLSASKIAIISFAFTANFAYAQQGSLLINGVSVEAIGAGKAYIQPDGSVTTGMGFRTQVGSNAPKFYERAVNATKAQTGANIKGWLKSGVKGLPFQILSVIIANYAIQGLGWGLDAITGDIYATPAQNAQLTVNGTTNYWSVALATKTGKGVDPITAFRDAAIQYYGSVDGTLTVVACPSNTQCEVKQTFSSGGSQSKYVYLNLAPAGWPSTLTPAQVSSQPATPATDTEVADKIAPKLTADQLGQTATDPNTGAVKKTQPVINEMTKLANAEAKLANPNSVDVTAPTATTTASGDTQTSGARDQPPFCIYAKYLCDWVDWTKTPPDNDPPDIEIPTTSIANPVIWTSGLGEGSCPANRALNFTFLSAQQFTWQPICQFAVQLKPLVIASSGLFALFILAGVRRRGDA